MGKSARTKYINLGGRIDEYKSGEGLYQEFYKYIS